MSEVDPYNDCDDEMVEAIESDAMLKKINGLEKANTDQGELIVSLRGEVAELKKELAIWEGRLATSDWPDTERAEVLGLLEDIQLGGLSDDQIDMRIELAIQKLKGEK